MATKANTVKELQSLNAQCGNTKNLLETALRDIEIMQVTEMSRESALVKTKIEEAIMWLDKNHADICIRLANKTCL